MHRGRHEDTRATGLTAGHQGRLGGCGRAVVVGRGDDRQGRQLREQRLVLVDALERSLRDLGLVWRVGGVPLAAQEQLIDGRRAPVAVDPGSQERGEVGPVALGEGRQPAGEIELRLGRGQAQLRGAQLGWDVGEQLVDRFDPERLEHPGTIVGGVRTVGHAQASAVRRS
jgi:hypothetical protein